MFQTVEGFLQMWKYEVMETQKVLDVLTDQSLEQEIAPGHWSLGRVAWHITTAIKVMGSQTGLQFDGPDKDFPVPESATYIADQYRKMGELFADAVKNQWTDNTLSEVHNVFGRDMSNGALLMYIIHHQIHHRGQLTVLMRQAGLTVPGVYGPSKEEWSKMGMEPPKM
ncbi:DinB family protein [Heyndrickxia oleronia]|uniref:DinB family protein n=1 Tax=Heyndrickxia oleronia TaxID=38875 RepID=A0AAW6T4Z6_9BACI|nr:DinB family protein [Heyndrickxia oleronia]MDH5164369.1 DinB family protein [Heyndrickxia oleronia]